MSTSSTQWERTYVLTRSTLRATGLNVVGELTTCRESRNRTQTTEQQGCSDVFAVHPPVQALAR